MLDPRVAYPCPKCRQPLVFVLADGAWVFYRCLQHRIVVLSSRPERLRRFIADLGDHTMN